MKQRLSQMTYTSIRGFTVCLVQKSGEILQQMLVNSTIIYALPIRHEKKKSKYCRKKTFVHCSSSAYSLRLNPNSSAFCLIFMPAVRLCLQKSVICSPHGLGLWPACRVTICRCSRRYGCTTVSALQTVPNVKATAAQRVDRECSVSLRGDVKETHYRVYSLRERSTPACSIYWQTVMQSHNITSTMHILHWPHVRLLHILIHRWFGDSGQKRNTRKSRRKTCRQI